MTMIDLSEENPDYLVSLERAIVRERAIRQGMAKTGEGREVVAETLDAMQSMDQEAVLDLAEGQPTTLQDALARYVRILETWDEVIPRDRVMTDLDAILEYPWPQEEAVIALHNPHYGLALHVETMEYDRTEIRMGNNRHLVASIIHPGEGADAVSEAAEAVYRAVLARVIADRDHHVQLNSKQRAQLIAFLEYPNGSWTGGGRLSVDAVAGGGVLVRTRPYSRASEATVGAERRRAEESR